MQLSKSNQTLIQMKELGYTILNKQICNPEGKILSSFIKHKIGKWGKPYESIHSQVYINGKKCVIIVARFIAYLKFGDQLFQKGIIVRHKNNNSLDNSDDNIILGTPFENYYDIPEEERLKTNLLCAHKKRKLTDEQIRDIQRRVILLNEDRWDLKREYGVTISSICNYVNWEFKELNWIKYFRKFRRQWIFLG